ncbi:MAG: ACT domain-containing protein [Myxococcota bacterium]|nr:ACT domain-containing protein [Myxococcota bacterium]
MSLSGEKNLRALLRSMRPALLEGTYAYVSVPKDQPIPARLSPVMSFREPEGWSLLLEQKEAVTSGLVATYLCRGISLNVHSSLYAVGFLAVIAERLAKATISINIASAYYRDYIFVPMDRAEDALQLLRKLAQE